MKLAAVLILSALPVLAQVPETDGYRMDEYRSPVPDTLAGATVIGPEKAHEHWQAGAAFIDVLPQAPKPANLPEATLWRDKPRLSIPGALWLPNVGYGAIAEPTAAYFRSGLDMVTHGDTARPLVFFCLEDCWMSWNAAKRAVEWGYTAVYWLPDGTDGWAFFDYPLEQIKPLEPQPR
ncbi:PQQ-dependent catabolism-associated CXXCW motif protein [Tropicibacter sp. S64]|uniref:PQQ-dependent catabolism-associated CXXCW motif protein n=1 Tax=Tropicibacter sp. S64 TaxID=3415122 RepID=UPI003C7B0B22